MEETLTIGQLARRAGVASSAIRYYERVGVLPEPERLGGQRRYAPDALRRLEVLGVAQQAGFSLDEIRVLLQTADAGTPAYETVRVLAQRKLPDVEALIARAEHMRAWLTAAVDCTCETFDACALFEPATGEPPTRRQSRA